MKKVLIGLCAVLFALPTIARAEFEMPAILTSEDLEEMKGELAEISVSNPSKALFDAIENGDLAAVKKAIKKGADVNRFYNVPILEREDRTPIMAAIMAGCNLEIAKLLVENGANESINTPDVHGDTPLHYAVSWGCDADMIDFLTSNGADINARNDQDFTPIFYNLIDPSREEVLINAGAEVNVRGPGGWTPLMAIVHTFGIAQITDLNGTVRTYPMPKDGVVQVLLKNGADVNIKNDDDKTALDLLVEIHDKYLEVDAEDDYNELFQMLTEAANK